MSIKKKQIIATIFLKDGNLVTSFQDHTPGGCVENLIQSFNDGGIDRIHVFDLSDGVKEHEMNLDVLKQINEISEIPVYAGGNINSLEDMRKILYTGCEKVVLNSLKEDTLEFAKEGSVRFGKDRLAMSIFNADIFFKHNKVLQDNISEVILLNDRLPGTLESFTEMNYTVYTSNVTQEKIAQMLTSEDSIQGISCACFCTEPEKVMVLKDFLKTQGIPTGHLESSIPWSEFKLNSDGMVPVIVQDFKTNDVLMLAYMNEEAYETTLSIGKMTYYSRSRDELWIKGLTSGHFQYVKSLTIDCDKDTILAKVSQVGAACHTGNRTCFFTGLASQQTAERNLYGELEREYSVIKDRMLNPKEGSNTTALFEQGMDHILSKMGKEATEIVIAAKNENKEQVKDEIADFLYYMMAMMVSKGIELDEIAEELSVR